MRIVSFLPSATEIVYALELGEQLVGATHECDYPEEAQTKPVVVRSAIETNSLSPQQVDESVCHALKAGQSLYVVDETLLRELRPDLILTQDLCQVCAIGASGMRIQDARGVEKSPDGMMKDRGLASYTHLHFGSHLATLRHLVDHLRKRRRKNAVSSL